MRTLPKRGCSIGGKYFLCISKKPATVTDSAAERFPATEGKESKRKTLEKAQNQCGRPQDFLDIDPRGCFPNMFFCSGGTQVPASCVV